MLHRTPPNGFTLFEVVLALVLVAFGLLALSATGALVTREMGVAEHRLAAAVVARNRVEWLASTPCALVASGVATHVHGVREWWFVEQSGSTVQLRDSVVVAEPRGSRTLVLASSRSC